jgi:hypothetical protein
MKHCSLLIIVAITLAACAGAAPPPPLASPGLASIAPPTLSGLTPTATAGRVAVFPNTLIVYQREGGFSGKSEKWTIYPTGRIVSDTGTAWQVPAEQVAPLFMLVEAPDFANLNAKYPVANACADCYVYTLMVYGQGEPKSVTYVEGAALPAHLQQVLSEINKAIAR